jgi:hypothetical protein
MRSFFSCFEEVRLHLFIFVGWNVTSRAVILSSIALHRPPPPSSFGPAVAPSVMVVEELFA